MRSLGPVLQQSILPILKDTAKIWQPADFLPDPSSEGFIDEVCQLHLVFSSQLITQASAPWPRDPPCYCSLAT